MLPVFGGAAHHGGAAYIYVFNRIVQCAIGHSNCGFKRVQIDHQQVDGFNAVVLQGLHMCRHITPRQQAAMHFGMQSFDTSVEHFRKTCQIGHFANWQTLCGE